MLRGIQKVDRYLVSPVLIVLLRGHLPAAKWRHLGRSESWVSVGFVAIVVLFGLSHGLFRPQTARRWRSPKAI